LINFDPSFRDLFYNTTVAGDDSLSQHHHGRLQAFNSVPLARPGEEITVDPNVYTGPGGRGGRGGDLVVDHPVHIDPPPVQTATDNGVKAEQVSRMSLTTKD
jgi:hypothetical protein